MQRSDPLQEPVSQDITRSDEPDTKDDLSEGAVGFQDMSNSESGNFYSACFIKRKENDIQMQL